MDDIIEYLCRLGFSKLEAQIYVNLLGNQGLTGYQIAKNLNISRSSVYPALENMYKKGIVLLVKGDALSYIAENPETLIESLKNSFKYNASIAEEKLSKISKPNSDERFVNITGKENVIAKAKALIMQTKQELLINIDGDVMELFRDELVEVCNRGVRVMIFSFGDMDVEGLNIELYLHAGFKTKNIFPKRIMLVSDATSTLVADYYKKRGTWLGTITDNNLMVSIVNEHILHDIYLLKYENAFPQSEFFKDNLVCSLLEKSRGKKR